jgi:hypothetical protein
MTENIDIEWSDVDRDSLEKRGFTLSESFAVKDLATCRVVLRAKEICIESTLKTLSGNPICSSNGPTVLEALWNLSSEFRQYRDELDEMDDDLDDLSRDMESEYTRNEP